MSDDQIDAAQYEALRVERVGPVLRVTIDHPESPLNTVDALLHDEFTRLFAALKRESEARWVLAAFVASFTLMNVLYYTGGYNRFLGLAHIIFWTPLLIFLYRRVTKLLGPRRYESWIRILLASNGVSLVIDYVDVLRYLLGDRT